MKNLLLALVATLVIAAVGCASCGHPQPSDPPESLGKAQAGLTSCKTCSNVTPQHPVVLVHGRGDTPARWNNLVTNWSSKGYVENTNLFRIDLAAYCGSNGFCSMLPAPDGTGATYVNESYAKCLKRYVDEKVPCDSDAGTCPTVDIVTHSQGGVVARHYAQFLAAPRQIDGLVVMSATHNGITNCTLAGSCTGVNPEVCPDSAFLRKLNGVSPQGDGSNDETPGSVPNGTIRYSATVSTGDKTVPPWCGGQFILNPQTQQGDDLSCSGSGNYTLDPEAGSCKLSNVQHLVVPTNTTAINDAYCKVN